MLSKTVRLNSTHCFFMKIANKQELQQITINHSLQIDFKDFFNLYKKYNAKPFFYLVIDTTLASDNLMSIVYECGVIMINCANFLSGTKVNNALDDC